MLPAGHLVAASHAGQAGALPHGGQVWGTAAVLCATARCTLIAPCIAGLRAPAALLLVPACCICHPPLILHVPSEAQAMPGCPCDHLPLPVAAPTLRLSSLVQQPPPCYFCAGLLASSAFLCKHSMQSITTNLTGLQVPPNRQAQERSARCPCKRAAAVPRHGPGGGQHPYHKTGAPDQSSPCCTSVLSPKRPSF